MTWIPLLLADPSPLLRLRVLCNLLGRTAGDVEVQELSILAEKDPLIMRLLALQFQDGSWKGGLSNDTSASNPILATSIALMRLGYLGLASSHPAVRRAVEFLFSRQLDDGSWPAPETGEESSGRETYSMRPLQTSIPLRGLAVSGFAEDPRAAKAYDWLLAQRLPDGAWPTGLASGVYGGVAGYRKLPHSRWGCRSNTTGALICLAYHPERCSGSEARRALDLLLGRETREAAQIGFEVARLVGAEPFHGFTTIYARFDLALLLDLCARIGASNSDERVSSLVEFIRNQQGPYGLWEYPARPQISRWLTVDLLCSLSRLTTTEPGDTTWLSLEPRTPFRAYPKKDKRY